MMNRPPKDSPVKAFLKHYGRMSIQDKIETLVWISDLAESELRGFETEKYLFTVKTK